MATNTSSNILGPDHLTRVNDALSKLQEAERELALAKRAGLTTAIQGQSIPELEAQITSLKAKLAQVKNTYFPNAS